VGNLNKMGLANQISSIRPAALVCAAHPPLIPAKAVMTEERAG
jgi:hypothetical protein